MSKTKAALCAIGFSGGIIVFVTLYIVSTAFYAKTLFYVLCGCWVLLAFAGVCALGVELYRHLRKGDL